MSSGCIQIGSRNTTVEKELIDVDDKSRCGREIKENNDSVWTRKEM